MLSRLVIHAGETGRAGPARPATRGRRVLTRPRLTEARVADSECLRHRAPRLNRPYRRGVARRENDARRIKDDDIRTSANGPTSPGNAAHRAGADGADSRAVPFHEEKTPSFTVEPARASTSFGCGEGATCSASAEVEAMSSRAASGARNRRLRMRYEELTPASARHGPAHRISEASWKRRYTPAGASRADGSERGLLKSAVGRPRPRSYASAGHRIWDGCRETAGARVRPRS